MFNPTYGAFSRLARLISITAVLAGMASAFAACPAFASRPIVVLSVEGIIDPVQVNYVTRGFAKAEKLEAQCVILKINTPGGLEVSMREIVQVILNSRVPAVAYVEPKGARAASAGAFIVMACEKSAMAPGTTIGAAHPVALQGKEITKTLDKKITNDASAFMRSLAKQRGRDVKWAEETVTKSVSANETEALAKKVIDYVADDLDSLLSQLDGVSMGSGKNRAKIEVKGAALETVETTGRERFFHMLAHPEIAYILLMLGTMGLIFELQSPGIGFGGFVGAVCLILALISLSILPFNAGGLALMALGIGLFFADIKLATHGALSMLGIISLLLGSLMLFSPIEPFWRISRTVVVVMVGLTGAFFAIIAWLGLGTLRLRAASGRESLVGAKGVATTALSPDGIVHLMGEDWSASPAEGVRKIRKGEAVVVKYVKGLKLEVEPVENEEVRKAPGTKTRRNQ